MPGLPFVTSIGKELRTPTVETPWGAVATEPGASFLEPNNSPNAFRCPKCNTLMEPGFFAEGRCIRCNYAWRAKDAIDMLIEAETMRVAHGGWAKEQLDTLEDKRGLQESVIMKRGGDIAQLTAAKRNLSEWYQRERKKVFAEINRRAEHNAVTNHLRSQSPLARL